MNRLQRLIPMLQWLPGYRREELAGDLVAGAIVAIMLVPQAMAYAMLAGLPPAVGLYASLAPVVLYALFGSSRYLAVGPVAIVSLLVAHAAADVAGAADAISVALVLALFSGVILIGLGVARLGWLANFMSHPVIAGFTSAAAIVIGLSQMKSLLGFPVPRSDLVTDTLYYLITHLSSTNSVTLALGLGAIVLMLLMRGPLERVLSGLGVHATVITVASKTGPLLAVLGGTLLVAALRLDVSNGVEITGAIPSGLPALTWPSADLDLWASLAGPALIIVFVGFVESASVAKALASRRREKIDNNRELIALGFANVGAAVTGGYPVTGGLSRSAVNFAAGARTPMASVITAGWVLVTLLLFTPAFYYLPRAVLAAVILVAVASLIDVDAFRRAWRYNKPDAVALLATFLAVLSLGVEVGIAVGVGLSLLLFLFRSSRPHIAVVGRVGNTQHYRNVLRHEVRTWPSILALRVDESLYFANTRYLEDYLLGAVADDPRVEHVVLICSAVNFVDMSALEALESLIEELRGAGVTLHLAEVKGPVMDQFQRVDFVERLKPGRVFLSTHEAMAQLQPAPA